MRAIALAALLLASPAYAYQGTQLVGTVTHVRDADTLCLQVKVGREADFNWCFRLAGIQAPEFRSRCESEEARNHERQLAYESTAYVTNLLLAKQVVVQTEWRPTFDRYEGRVLFFESGELIDLGERLIAKGYAVAWDDDTRTKAYCG